MQPGGKPKDGEPLLIALDRELREELGCSFGFVQPVFLGIFRATAANEDGCAVEGLLYAVELAGPIRVAAEIEEFAWVSPDPPYQLELAPLTREHVLPLARSHSA